MDTVINRLQSFFEAEGWPVALDPDDGRLTTGVRTEANQWTCQAMALTPSAGFVFYSICPLRCPEETRPDVAELLTALNYGLVLATFELGLATGEVRCRTSSALVAEQLTPEVCGAHIHANIQLMDRFLPSIIGVASGTRDTNQALAGFREELEG